jgi:hypothetical protein
VKWKDYSSDWNSFEPIGHLVGCQKLVRDFLDSLNDQETPKDAPATPEGTSRTNQLRTIETFRDRKNRVQVVLSESEEDDAFINLDGWTPWRKRISDGETSPDKKTTEKNEHGSVRENTVSSRESDEEENSEVDVVANNDDMGDIEVVANDNEVHGKWTGSLISSFDDYRFCYF